MADLNSILGNEDTSAETKVEEQEQNQDEGHEATGDEQATPPVEEEQHQEEESDRRVKGFQAAAVAERQKRQQAEQRAQQFEQELAQYRQQFQPQKQAANSQAQEPARADFATDVEYLRAVTKFDAQQQREADKEEAKQRQEMERAQSEKLSEQQAINETVQKGKAKYRDFDAVINDGLGPFLTHEFAKTLMVSDKAEDIAYALGKDPLEAERISKLSPSKMLHAIGLMEARLSDEPQGTRAGPTTLTQVRNATGQYQKAYGGPTPLDDILQRK